MSQQPRRRIWDELLDLGRRLLERLDDMLNPDSREPARVPVPVRNDKRRPLRDSQR